jgi:hypothetical protein
LKENEKKLNDEMRQLKEDIEMIHFSNNVGHNKFKGKR